MACHASFQDVPSTRGLPLCPQVQGPLCNLGTLDPLSGPWPSAGTPQLSPRAFLPQLYHIRGTEGPRATSSPFPFARGAHGPFPTPTRDSCHSPFPRVSAYPTHMPVTHAVSHMLHHGGLPGALVQTTKARSPHWSALVHPHPCSPLHLLPALRRDHWGPVQLHTQ